MIIESKNLQSVCKKVLDAVDTSSTQRVSETLELEVVGKKLVLSVTNREYFVSISIPLDDTCEFKAVVDAKLFLNLVSKITTKEIELLSEGNTLVVKANGVYKLAMIYDGDSLITLPRIDIVNETNSFNIPSERLHSILNFNSKEVNKNVALKPVMKMFYLDENGCITFTGSSACINSFKLGSQIKLLLNQKVVKLFKLFDNGDVSFSIGYDTVGDKLQQKVKFENNDVTLTAITNADDIMVNSVPVSAIRGRADKQYPYSVVLKRVDVIDSLNRLLLFKGDNTNSDIGIFEFDSNGVSIYDMAKDNYELVSYNTSNLSGDSKCSIILDIANLRNTLCGCDNDFVSFYFGDGQAVVINEGNVKNVITEYHTSR